MSCSASGKLAKCTEEVLNYLSFEHGSLFPAVDQFSGNGCASDGALLVLEYCCCD